MRAKLGTPFTDVRGAPVTSVLPRPLGFEEAGDELFLTVQDIPEVTGCAHLGTSCTCSDLPCKSLSDITTSAGMLTETRSTLVSSDGISSRHRKLFEGVRLEPLEEGMRKDSVPRVDDNMEAWEKGSCDGTRSSILEEADPWSTPSMLDPCWTEPAPRGLEIVARCGPGCALPDSRGTLDGAALRSDRTPSPERLHAAAEGSFDHRDSIIANLISQTADMHAQLLQAQDQVLGVGARAGGQTSIAPHLSPASGEDPVSSVTQSRPQLVGEAKRKPRKLSKKERERQQRRALAAGRGGGKTASVNGVNAEGPDLV